jgi:hypothetical protein
MGERTNPLANFIAGGVGGSLAVITGHPFDTIKVCCTRISYMFHPPCIGARANGAQTETGRSGHVQWRARLFQTDHRKGGSLAFIHHLYTCPLV